MRPYTRRKRHADEVIARENAGPAPTTRRGYVLPSNRALRQLQHKQARQEARRVVREAIRGNGDDDISN